MVLFITAINRQAQARQFSYHTGELEKALDLLSSIIELGDTLLKVQIADEDGLLELPLEAFDKEPFSDAIHQLKIEWERILAQPVSPQLVPVLADDLNQRVQKLHQNQEASLRATIDRIQDLIEHTEESLREGTRKARLVTHYQVMIDRYRHSLDKLQECYMITLHRLL